MGPSFAVKFLNLIHFKKNTVHATKTTVHNLYFVIKSRLIDFCRVKF